MKQEKKNKRHGVPLMSDPNIILRFWFEECTPEQWFKVDEKFDRMIAERFSACHEAAANGELYSWRSTPRGRLAEIIVLDQFSRNIYRNKPQAFAQDGMALILSQELVLLGLDKELSEKERSFAYMPYMHSESIAVHDIAVNLFNRPGLEENFRFEKAHRDIIHRFGRYPHRNKILGRDSTQEEVEFLKTPGSSF